jgi:hypothetical protein
MKTQALIMTLLLTGSQAMTAHAAHGFTVDLSDGSPLAGKPAMQLAWLSEEEISSIRRQWQSVAPDERDRLRKKLREEHGVNVEDGFGMGFESRRRDSDSDSDGGSERDRGWGKGRSGDKSRDERRGRR